MFKALASAATSAVSSLHNSPIPPGDSHDDPGRIKQYAEMARALQHDDIPVSHADCESCNIPCEFKDRPNGNGPAAQIGNAWDGKTYDEYVEDKYGCLEGMPATVEQDWESDLAGSGGPPVGRVVVVSTGKSNWLRDHVEEEAGLSYKINQVLLEQPNTAKKSKGGNPLDPSTYIKASAFPTPSSPFTKPVAQLPALYSSSMVSQSEAPTDQMTIVFPDWKVCLEVENSREGAQALWDGALSGTLGRAGHLLQKNGAGVERRRSYVLPYRAIVLLCSHKNRDKRCHITAGLLRPALIGCLEQNGVTVDELGSSLANLDGPPLEELEGSDAEREAEIGRRIENIENVHGGQGGEVGVFNISHLGGHRYAGVMLILFPSGAYLSYGRVSPHEIPRVVEETILQGKVVPGLIRSGTGLARPGAANKDTGFLTW
ncbi:hypothetical protein CspeluHIS016_0405660 [Cutaneotrichosporon spelunceum]|uniref:Sucraseferredoxin-like protein n=1 Tax=Cutaneotrichosporon spelunceum TaxID=1672016 RepID=A0AAD3TWJ5_9TREE|nr:hypothetical protein CspeluHIS016_0405660 [Cutaneotrichosporon spelunceum]